MHSTNLQFLDEFFYFIWNAIDIVLVVVVLVLFRPSLVRKKIEQGKLPKASIWLYVILIWFAACAIIAHAVYKILYGYPKAP